MQRRQTVLRATRSRISPKSAQKREWNNFKFFEFLIFIGYSDMRLYMTKIGNTSIVKGVEAALCLDLNGEIARVVDREKNGIVSSLATNEVSVYQCLLHAGSKE
jgi:hypothetical protein